MDVTAGYQWSGEPASTDGASAAKGRDATTSVAARRLFGAINANAFLTAGSWIVGARVGYLYADHREQELQDTRKHPSGLVGQGDEISQGHISLDVGYGFASFAPFARVSYLRSFTFSDATTESDNMQSTSAALRLATGVRFFAADALSGRFEIERDFTDDNVEGTSASFILRAEF